MRAAGARLRRASRRRPAAAGACKRPDPAGMRKRPDPADVRRRTSGQATVELAVAFPVLVIVAVIAVNAVLFFSECAAFDRVARDAVRTHAASPAYGQGVEQSRALVAAAVDAAADRPYLESQVAVEGGGMGHTTFTATLEFSPTLFGLGLKSEVLGVPLPRLRHSVSMTVDAYKPGVLL